MDRFFSNCGQLIGHSSQRSEGLHPTIVVKFSYTNGHATFDGREWSFNLYN